MPSPVPPPDDSSSPQVDAFVRLLGQNQRRIFLYVMSLVPNWNDAEEIIQETNLVLWREFARFELGTNFTAWACKVALHQVLAWRKRVKRNRPRVQSGVPRGGRRRSQRGGRRAGGTLAVPGPLHRAASRGAPADAPDGATATAWQSRRSPASSSAPARRFIALSRIRRASRLCHALASAGGSIMTVPGMGSTNCTSFARPSSRGG